MNQTTAASKTSSPFANLLKKWRKVRKYSQLELSLEAGISQRHLSFLESGRSRPLKAGQRHHYSLDRGFANAVKRS